MEGRRREREYPSKAAYQEHSANDLNPNLEPKSLSGGLYTRYTLRDFYPAGLTQYLGANPYPQSKSWQGSPYPALRRGFRALGTMARAFPEQVVKDLRQLSDMYDRNTLPEDQTPTEKAIRNRSDPPDTEEDETGGTADIRVLQTRNLPSRSQEGLGPKASTSRGQSGSTSDTCGHKERRPPHLDTFRYQNTQDGNRDMGSQPTSVRPDAHRTQHFERLQGQDHEEKQPTLQPKEQFLPDKSNWPTSIKEVMKYPGLRPDLAPKSAPSHRWRYGPCSTSQTMVDYRTKVIGKIPWKGSSCTTKSVLY